MNRQLALLSSMLALSVLLPTSESMAFNATACGFESDDGPLPVTQHSCGFRFTGTPIKISVYSHGSSSVVPKVRIWISPGENQEVSLFECSNSVGGSGGTYSSCARELSLIVTELLAPDSPPSAHVTLSCNIEVAGDGPQGFRCESPER